MSIFSFNCNCSRSGCEETYTEMKQLLDEVKELHEEAAVDKAKDKDRLEKLKKKAVEDEAIALTMRAAGLQTLKNKPKVAPKHRTQQATLVMMIKMVWTVFQLIQLH